MPDNRETHLQGIHFFCWLLPADWYCLEEFFLMVNSWHRQYLWQRTSRQEWNGGFLKWWYPTTMGFPTKSDHFEVFWGYHHLRKHPNHPKRLEPGSCHPWRLDGFKVNMLTEIIKTASAVLMPPVKPIPGEEIPKKKSGTHLDVPLEVSKWETHGSRVVKLESTPQRSTWNLKMDGLVQMIFLKNQGCILRWTMLIFLGVWEFLDFLLLPLMEEILNQCEVSSFSPLFTWVWDTSNRWLWTGFLNHQQPCKDGKNLWVGLKWRCTFKNKIGGG